jgi:hypothetical protein
MTHCINRLFTVASPKTFATFRNPAGLAAVRHYALNENMLFDKQDHEKLGYFVADIERAGPYCMMAEANAIANGDPTMLGYLHGSNYGRGFPQYVREFNAHYLALPALPSERLTDASDDKDIVVRAIRTQHHGTWLAIVNTALTAKPHARIRLPAAGIARDAVTETPLPVTTGTLELSLHPCQLQSVHLK